MVELVGGKSLGVAGAGAVAVAGEAGVVAVPVAVAVGGAADEAGAAARAGDEPGEQVLGAVAGPLRVVLAAGDEDLLGGLEDVRIDYFAAGAARGGRCRGRTPRRGRPGLRSTVSTAAKFQGRPVRVVWPCSDSQVPMVRAPRCLTGRVKMPRLPSFILKSGTRRDGIRTRLSRPPHSIPAAGTAGHGQPRWHVPAPRVGTPRSESC